MDTLSYTPPGVQPPKGLERTVAQKKRRPCRGGVPGLVITTNATTPGPIWIDDCEPLTYLNE